MVEERRAMTKKCEHASAEFSGRKLAQSLADRLSDKTGTLHVVKRYGVMWIATCYVFDDYKKETK